MAYSGKLNANGIPAFEDLPLRKGDPHHSAWGLYGRDDERGTLNRLTNERVVDAAKGEVKSGVRCVTRYTLSLSFPFLFSSYLPDGLIYTT
jgi:hypothetical protein